MRIIYFIVIILFISSCKDESKSEPLDSDTVVQLTEAEQWVQKSLNYHDPERKFNSKPLTFSIQTFLKDSLDKPEERIRKVDIYPVEGKSMIMEKRDGVNRIYFLLNDSLMLESKERYKDTILVKQYRARARMLKKYYRYMIGGVNVLADESAIIQEQAIDTIYKGRIAVQIKVLYEPIGEEPEWYFMFDKETGEMIQSRFVRDAGTDKERGEFIDYGPYEEVNGMKMPSRIVWYYLNGDFLAREEIVYGPLKLTKHKG